MPKSVVSIHRMSAFGGAERYAAYLCEALLQEGHEVCLLTSGRVSVEEIEKYFGLSLTGLKIKEIDLRLPRLPEELKRFLLDAYKMNLVRQEGADYYFECSYKSETFGVAPKNYYICHFPHQVNKDFNSPVRRIYFNSIQLLRKLLLGRGKRFQDTYDAILANSQFTQGHVGQRWGVPSSVLYPPCSLGGRKESHPIKEKKIVSVGRFEQPLPNIPHKGQHYLIEAFKELEGLHRDGWELHLAGSCRSASAEAYLAELRVQAEGFPVYFHPNMEIEDLENLLGSSTLYWHAQGYGQDLESFPETQEHFGITTVEAMAAGSIPIVINSAGPKEVAEGQGGETWDSLEELRQKSLKVLELPPEELANRQQVCRERASFFSEERFTERLGSLLRESSAKS